MDLVTLGEVHKTTHGHATGVIVVAERHVDGRDVPQACEKPEKRRSSIGEIQQVPGDKDPVRLQLRNLPKDLVMPREIPINVKIADLDRAPAGQGSMTALDASNSGGVKPVLPRRQSAEEPIQGDREAVQQVLLHPPKPCGRARVLCTHAQPTRDAVDGRSTASISLKVPLRFPHRLHRATKTTSFVRALAHRVNVYRSHPQNRQGTPASCAGACPMLPVR
jgi:hypothetical protein